MEATALSEMLVTTDDITQQYMVSEKSLCTCRKLDSG